MKAQLLLSIGFTLNVILAEGTENITANNEQDRTIKSSRGVFSHIVEDIIVPPLKSAADRVDSMLKAIYPGTQWCGDGNRARSASDLGLFKLTDRCCREHDNCPDYISAGKAKHGLNNTSLFTRSNCDCDDKFYDCLKIANTLISLNIGVSYFNILRPKCFKEDYPVSVCEEYEGFILRRCTKYKMDNSSAKIWQWFDPKKF